MIREYTVNSGLYKGIHFIFDNSEELLKKFPNINIWKWRDNQFDSYEVGDWVKADDGYYIQILNIRKLYTKKDKYNINTFVRFPVGTFCVYRKRAGGFNYPKLLASISKLDTSSISGYYRNLDRDVMQKVKFASYVLAGVEPGKAYILAFKPMQALTTYQYKRKAITLMADEIVKHEIKTQLQHFNSKVDDVFSVERIINELDLLIKSSRKGSKDHRENLELIMDLKGLKERSTGYKKETKISNAQFEEIPVHMKD